MRLATTLLQTLAVAGVFSASVVRADPAPPDPLQQTDAFERAYSASYYEFDACGDGLGGRIFRTAITQKVMQCPFSADAKKRFQQDAVLLRRHGSETMEKLIETHGGLPVQLAGMTQTCREQRESAVYRELRERLDAFAAGRADSNSVVIAPCDASSVTP